MPILTHNEAALAASLLEAYRTSLDGNLGEVHLKLADTPENRAIAVAVMKQRDPDADVTCPRLLVSEAGLAEYMRRRLLDTGTVCEVCGHECDTPRLAGVRGDEDATTS